MPQIVIFLKKLPNREKYDGDTTWHKGKHLASQFVTSTWNPNKKPAVIKIYHKVVILLSELFES